MLGVERVPKEDPSPSLVEIAMVLSQEEGSPSQEVLLQPQVVPFPSLGGIPVAHLKMAAKSLFVVDRESAQAMEAMPHSQVATSGPLQLFLSQMQQDVGDMFLSLLGHRMALLQGRTSMSMQAKVDPQQLQGALYP